MEQPEDPSNPSTNAPRHHVVAQATGVLMAQLTLSPDAALDKLTAEAANQGRPVLDVAHEVVQHLGLTVGDGESP